MDSNYSFEEADFLLKRDWFFDRQGIDELLNELHDDVFWNIFDIRHTYSERVCDAFYQHETKPTTTVKDITDEMMEVVWTQRNEERTKRRSESIKAYIPPPRPRNIWDDQYDALLAQNEKLYNDYHKLAKQPNYNKLKIEKVNVDIQMLENEIKTIKQKVDSYNKTYHELQWIENVALVSAKHTF